MISNIQTLQKFYTIIYKIPAGKVATYGQIAAIAGYPRKARLVGYALKGMGERSTVPWYRVINAQGKISFPEHSEHYSIQKTILESEGIVFSKSGKIDLRKFQWEGRK